MFFKNSVPCLHQARSQLCKLRASLGCLTAEVSLVQVRQKQCVALGTNQIGKREVHLQAKNKVLDGFAHLSQISLVYEDAQMHQGTQVRQSAPIH